MCELLKCIYTICIIFYSELMTSALYIDKIMIFHLFTLRMDRTQSYEHWSSRTARGGCFWADINTVKENL